MSNCAIPYFIKAKLSFALLIKEKPKLPCLIQSTCTYYATTQKSHHWSTDWLDSSNTTLTYFKLIPTSQEVLLSWFILLRIHETNRTALKLGDNTSTQRQKTLPLATINKIVAF